MGPWGARYSPIQSRLEQRLKNASTCFSDVDGRNVSLEAKASGTQTVSFCADAGASLPLQSGMRRLRQDSISSAHFEEGINAGRVLQSGGRMRHAYGLHSG